MKIISFGALNLDHVYNVPHMVMPGETITSDALNDYAGGKGLNQSVAAARAGADVVHMGAIGYDGEFMVDLLKAAGANTENILRLPTSSGHTIIQVTPEGQNSIIVFGGANRMLTEEYVCQCLEKAEKDDFVLLQDETNISRCVIREAAKRGLRVVFNPSPVSKEINSYPLNDVSIFIVNEIEGAQLAGMELDAEPQCLLDKLCEMYPKADIILTLGKRDLICCIDGKRYTQKVFLVNTVDTTAAGDTFCGYLLAALCDRLDVPQALERAAAASAICVSRPGAAPSIPTKEEVNVFLKNYK